MVVKIGLRCNFFCVRADLLKNLRKISKLQDQRQILRITQPQIIIFGVAIYYLVACRLGNIGAILLRDHSVIPCICLPIKPSYKTAICSNMPQSTIFYQVIKFC